ncbi:N-formylglutamate amidohydrolase [Bordetella pertussis]|uniref:N-formylglutamate deformylase n=16 Tax=Bordetella pertussis TaxID=520 RepID=Q7VVE6_BORPE|nr:N-formylglutamate deformylase [Bordetella pertussis]ETH37443.1 N-formylglutamate deformylase [Bordetella pertussis H918]ETH43631.1 N-formylglutamate deformylase [Bordetella pertussis H939]ETH47578.1 N-formylglutamate deformylase [Bordetella pertussis H921]ETH70980.1 N-formylglutamate deformylase [Bordetella pertussis STO1-CHLA-0011]ETH89177.1 N-formylglutamate deformylase [Bordetella pertussis STO1-CHOC-0019]ETH99813.1 N-formylglutamate deformylase [Bordetella pertussis STO1-CHOM-0012]KCV
MSTLYTLTRGDAPLVVNIPHGGTWVPAELRPLMQAEALGVPDTDWHVDRLYDFVRARGVTLMAATHSRYVIDLNRDPDGGVLYPGASNTELCPTTRFDGGPVWKDEAAGHLLLDVAARRRQYFDPYHAQLAAELARVQARHGYAVLLDGHSIISHCARFFDGKLPDLNLGTADGASCPPGLQQAAAQALQADGFTAAVNGRFKGGWITRHYGRPAEGYHALQLEMALSAYMTEQAPFHWQPERAEPLRQVLETLVAALLAWRAA